MGGGGEDINNNDHEDNDKENKPDDEADDDDRVVFTGANSFFVTGCSLPSSVTSFLLLLVVVPLLAFSPELVVLEPELELELLALVLLGEVVELLLSGASPPLENFCTGFLTAGFSGASPPLTNCAVEADFGAAADDDVESPLAACLGVNKNSTSLLAPALTREAMDSDGDEDDSLVTGAFFFSGASSTSTGDASADDLLDLALLLLLLLLLLVVAGGVAGVAPAKRGHERMRREGLEGRERG